MTPMFVRVAHLHTVSLTLGATLLLASAALLAAQEAPTKAPASAPACSAARIIFKAQSRLSRTWRAL